MTTQTSIPSDSLPDDVEKLKTLLLAMREERASEADRISRAVQDRQIVDLELGDMKVKYRNAMQVAAAAEGSGAGALMLALQSTRPAAKPGFAERAMSALLLPFARRAIRSGDYHRAQALYQAIAVFRPRPFLVKQVGNILFKQGQFKAALEVLEHARQALPGDGEIGFLINACEQAMPGRNESGLG